MKLQKSLIENRDWDYLIVLDACRYDTFDKLHDEYFKGNLNRVRSRGSSTGEWLYKTFPKKYKITYISGNPYINNEGISLGKCNIQYKDYGWVAKDHFCKIIDVWKEDWNEEYGTVLPDDINNVLLKLKNNTKNKIIAHYMQPHFPYINFSDPQNHDKAKKRAEGKSSPSLSENKKIILNPVKRLFHSLPKRLQLKIKEALGEDLGKHERLIVKNNVQRLKKIYKQNLEIVLKSLQEVIPKLNGKIIITADHGEAFGENGIWFHQLEVDSPVLKEVPWFEVEGIKD